MFRIQGLDHVVLRSTEPQCLVAFYRDVLGCTVERELNQIGLTQLRAGSALIDIIRFDDANVAGTSRSRNLDHFCLRVNPFDSTALRTYFTDRGIEIREVEKVYGAEGYGPAVYLDDPDGNTVELKGPASIDSGD